MMPEKRVPVVFAAAVAAAVGASPASAAAPATQEMNQAWGTNTVQCNVARDKENFFRNSKYAMFIHFGLFSAAGNIWNRQKDYGISEWMMNRLKIKVADYEKLADTFNPVNFNADEYVALAKAAGMRYIVITAKHHEGFAMFKSAHPYNIVDRTPFKRDPMRELAEACKKGGLGFGFYYSQNLDWHEICAWDESASTPFEKYFSEKSLMQIKELLTNYGDLAVIWFDTPGRMSREQSQQIVDLMQKHQPGALINSRVGNGVGDYSSQGDNEIPVKRHSGLWESPDTTNDSWGYSATDRNFKSAREILQRLITVSGRGGNYLLNIGPDGKGDVPPEVVSALKKAGEWLTRHGDTIYGTASSPWNYAQVWGDCTRRGNLLYLLVFNWRPGEKIYMYDMPGKIKSIQWRNPSGGKVELKSFEQNGFTAVELPLLKGDALCDVIEMELDAVKELDSDIIGIDPASPTLLAVEFAKTEKAAVVPVQWMEKHGEWKTAAVMTDWKKDGYGLWQIAVKDPGLYRISFRYSDLKHRLWQVSTDEGEVLDIEFNLTGNAGGVKRFHFMDGGVIEFKKSGVHTLKLQAQSPASGSLRGGMSLNSITVEKFD